MEDKKQYRVAVYGTLLAGERNAHWAAGALARVPATIRGTLYDTGFGYPTFVPRADGPAIAAEVLTVTEEGLARMDILEGYPTLYHRMQIKATLADGTATDALVYVMTRLPPGIRPIHENDWRPYRLAGKHARHF